jgi:hypothetical protein
MEIRVGEVGKIVAGKDVGHYVQVIDDKANSGGFLVLTAPTPDMHRGFDSWVENDEVLRRFFEESAWRVEWLARGAQG